MPLLPPHYIRDGLAVIEQEVSLHGLKNSFQVFVKYINETWLDESNVGPEMLSVYEQNERTNNAVESGYYKLFKKAEDQASILLDLFMVYIWHRCL